MAASNLSQARSMGQLSVGFARKLDTVRAISWLTAALVTMLALFAFILSYSSLQHLAAKNGLPGWLSYVWPLLLDFAMLVFSLAILRANLRQERAIYPWTLTIAFAGLATLANILDVTSLGLPAVVVAASVKALAPVALVLAFELLMSMLRAEMKRTAVVNSLAKLTQTQQQEQAELTRLTGQVDSLTAKREQLQSELQGLRQQQHEVRVDSLSRNDSVKKPVAAQSEEERLLNLAQANLARRVGTPVDFQRAAALRAEGLTWGQIAEALQVSAASAKRWAVKGQALEQQLAALREGQTISVNGK